MSVKRTCFMCGTEYEWCNTCHDFDATETWKYLYHDRNCLEVSKIWYSYRGGEISKDEAKKRMDKYPETIAAILEYTSIPAVEIKEIYNVPEQEPIKETEQETVITEKQPVEEKSVEEKDNANTGRKASSRRNNKK